jgi:hypothetical protein
LRAGGACNARNHGQEDRLVIAEVSTSRSRVRDWQGPVAVCRAGIDVRRRTSDQEGLILCAGVTVLDRDRFARLEKRKENINI